MDSPEQPAATEAQALPPGFRPVTSSNLKAIAWLGQAGEDLYAHENALQGNVEIIFHNGARWQYQGVDRETAHGLLTAESVGKFYNASIKGNEAFHAERVDQQQEPE